MKTYTHKHLGATDGAICSHEKCKQIYRRTSNHNCTVNFMQLCTTIIILASLVAQTVKRLPAVWETWVQSLDWEEPLQMEMATHSSTPA